MDLKQVISLVDVAIRFSKAKGMDATGYKWLRAAPGRGSNKDEQVGNSLAAMKAIRRFNAKNSKHIKVYAARGYDSTPKKMMVVQKEDVGRLKGYILRSASKPDRGAKAATPFKIISEVEV